MPGTLSESKKELLEKLLRGGSPISVRRHDIPRRPAGIDVPVSYGQQQIWLHSQLSTEVPIYNDPITIYRYGLLDRNALERTLTEIVRRHEAWRTTFEWKDGELIQIVQPPPKHIEIPYLDLSSAPATEREATALEIARGDASLPFNLTTGPLYRGHLVRFSETEHRLYLALHHIIFDGLSLYRIFVSELRAIYEAFSQNQASPLQELPVQYGDYAVWQRGWVDEITPRQLAYWRAKLRGTPQGDVLATDHPRPAVQTYRGAMAPIALDSDVSVALKEINRKLDVTLFVSLLATFYVTMWAHSGQQDLTIGTTSAGRHRSELEDLMGYFLDTLVLRVSLAGDPSFADLATQCKETMFGALANDGVPFSMLVKELSEERDSSRNPFFQVMFSLEPPLAPLGPTWKFARMDIHNGSTKFDLNIELDDTAHGIEGRLIYNCALFEQSTIERLIVDWYSIVAKVVGDPSRRVSEIAAHIEPRPDDPAGNEGETAVAETQQESTGFFSSVRRLFSNQ